MVRKVLSLGLIGCFAALSMPALASPEDWRTPERDQKFFQALNAFIEQIISRPNPDPRDVELATYIQSRIRVQPDSLPGYAMTCDAKARGMSDGEIISEFTNGTVEGDPSSAAVALPANTFFTLAAIMAYCPQYVPAQYRRQ